MKPLYLTEKSKYAVSDEDILNKNIFPPQALIVNPNNFISKGFNPIIDTIEVLPFGQFIPISLNNATPLVYSTNRTLNFATPIIDDNFVSIGVWQLKTGVAKVTFPTIPNSGYKLFIDLASEHFSENEPLRINFGGCSRSPSLTGGIAVNNIDIVDIDNDTDQKIVIVKDGASFIVDDITSNNFNGNITTKTFDVQAVSGSITLYIDANNAIKCVWMSSSN
jgi:hypothetical protein